MRLQDTFRADPNELRALPPGMALVISAGRACRVAVARASCAAVGEVGASGHQPGEEFLQRTAVEGADGEGNVMLSDWSERLGSGDTVALTGEAAERLRAAGVPL